MNHTKKLLQEIKNAISTGRLPAENVPIADIKECVHAEIEVNRSTFTEHQYTDVLNSYRTLCESISNEEKEKDRILFLIDALILCVDMLSQAVYSLANGEYWSYKHRAELDDPEIREIVRFVDRERKLQLINYEFVKEYESLPVEVFFDESCEMNYVLYKNRRMFFPRSWNDSKIADYYRGVLMEQDRRSPHCYCNDRCGVRPGDIVVDAGAAEGIFALDIMDTAAKIYLVEPDREWAEALEQTFRDNRDKVCLVSRFLGGVDQGESVSLDSLFSGEKINFIKMDIEGFEKEALQGGEELLERCDDIRCAICVYHCREDEDWVRNLLISHGFGTESSKGYMCPDWTMEAYLEAELRRGIIFGIKEKIF